PLSAQNLRATIFATQPLLVFATHLPERCRRLWSESVFVCPGRRKASGKFLRLPDRQSQNSRARLGGHRFFCALARTLPRLLWDLSTDRSAKLGRRAANRRLSRSAPDARRFLYRLIDDS